MRRDSVIAKRKSRDQGTVQNSRGNCRWVFLEECPVSFKPRESALFDRQIVERCDLAGPCQIVFPLFHEIELGKQAKRQTLRNCRGPRRPQLERPIGYEIKLKRERNRIPRLI